MWLLLHKCCINSSGRNHATHVKFCITLCPPPYGIDHVHIYLYIHFSMCIHLINNTWIYSHFKIWALEAKLWFLSPSPPVLIFYPEGITVLISFMSFQNFSICISIHVTDRSNLCLMMGLSFWPYKAENPISKDH